MAPRNSRGKAKGEKKKKEEKGNYLINSYTNKLIIIYYKYFEWFIIIN